MRIAVVYGSRAGLGGLGMQAAAALDSLAEVSEVIALGPGYAEPWPLSEELPRVQWRQPPPNPLWLSLLDHRLGRRLASGVLQLVADRLLGQWAVGQLGRLRPNLVYAFTQVGLESLRWAQRAGVPSVLDNPNGDLRGFAAAYRTEAARLLGEGWPGHPTSLMLARVVEEYALADRIRVSTTWARDSMIRQGVPRAKIAVFDQPVNLQRFRPVHEPRELSANTLRLAFVGSVDLRKGFVPLLRAIRRANSARRRGYSPRPQFVLDVVGYTGDAQSRRLLAQEQAGVDITLAPGDPVPVLRSAELLVLPSLEDGFGFAVAEAMAAGLPVLVTDTTGASTWVRSADPGRTGWVVPTRPIVKLDQRLAEVLEEVRHRRGELAQMGRAARAAVEARLGGPGDRRAYRRLADWVLAGDGRSDGDSSQ